ncbi:MAG TPA: lasso peptide biosynthesis B2 protein, partial [Vicinamibacterales bacterium]|nr:lasso peptide biosynthesis B2 protein [Vicinamibacterales bacterium]
MIRRLWRFGSLNRTDRGLVAEAAALLVLVKIGLQILRFYRLRRILDYYSRPHEDGPSLQYPVLRITQAIDRASRNLPLSVTCLVTALAADAMLKRRCLMSRLHLGVLDPSTRDGLEA